MVRVWPGVAMMLAWVVEVVIVVGQFDVGGAGGGGGARETVRVVAAVEVKITRDIVVVAWMRWMMIVLLARWMIEEQGCCCRADEISGFDCLDAYGFVVVSCR